MSERAPSDAVHPVPVLLYHAVTRTPGRHISPFAVHPSVLADHLDAVLDHGYRCLTMSEYLRQPRLGTDRIAVITFDDGYADFAEHALPLLRARSVPCTLYLTTGWLRGGGPAAPGPSDRMLHWSQVPELAAEGVEIGAHSHRHLHMDTLGRAALREELVRPKELLEEAVQAPVASFAYPHGYSGARVRRAAQQVGYTSGAAVRNAFSHLEEDPYQVARLMLRADTAPEHFLGWLDHRGAPLAPRHEGWRTRVWRAHRRSRALVHHTPVSDYR